MIGTVNVLEAVRQAGDGVLAVVVVTSDKCYENADQRSRRFVEEDPLGGSDPYSSSKACAELVTAAYRRSFFGEAGSPAIGSARAGNVLGGGDWGEDRLVPDTVRAVERREPLKVRNPRAVRPWQHVLSPLSGYLRLAEELAQGPPREAARAWNFGPPAGDERPVSWIVERLQELWRGELEWQQDERARTRRRRAISRSTPAPPKRCSAGAPRGSSSEALELVVAWHRAHRDGQDMRQVSLEQIARLG